MLALAPLGGCWVTSIKSMGLADVISGSNATDVEPPISAVALLVVITGRQLIMLIWMLDKEALEQPKTS